MNVLKEQGLSINREGKDYISVIAPDSGMKMRFRGDFYAWDWTLKAAPKEKSEKKKEALLLPQLQEDTIHDRNRTDADANLKRMEENCNARLTALSTRLDMQEDKQMLIQTELRTLKRLFNDVSEVYGSLQTLLATLKNGA